jgi:hypothetical protein
VLPTAIATILYVALRAGHEVAAHGSPRPEFLEHATGQLLRWKEYLP